MASLKKRKRKYSDEELEICRQMYMEFTPLSHIAKEMGIPRATLQNYERTLWKPERDSFSREMLSNMSAARRGSISGISNAAMKVMERALEGLAKSKKPPTVREALDAAKVVAELDKLAKLDNEVIEDDDVIEIDVTDPFAINAVEAEVKEEKTKKKTRKKK